MTRPDKTGIIFARDGECQLNAAKIRVNVEILNIEAKEELLVFQVYQKRREICGRFNCWCCHVSVYDAKSNITRHRRFGHASIKVAGMVTHTGTNMIIGMADGSVDLLDITRILS